MSLVDDEYYECHLFLRQVWDEMTALYEALSPQAQLAIHQYYRPSEELSRDQLLEHRRGVTQDRPDLEVVARHAYQQVHAAYGQNRRVDARPDPAQARPAQERSRARRKPPRGRERQLRVRGVPRPEPDLRLLAEALIDLAMDMRGEEASSPDGEEGDGS